MPAEPATTTPLAGRSLVSLLGEQRATIVGLLRRDADASVAELARVLDISEVATRRHLGVLEEDGLVAAQTVNQGRGRPAARYSLTADARRLFPQGHDQLATELLDFLAGHDGGDGLRAFMRWRLQRQVDGLRDAVTAEDLHERLEQLAGRLSAAGYEASVTPDGDGFTLKQHHCAIQDAAEEHPELCTYEAAGFARVLGTDVTISRRETLAEGGSACVCCVQPRTATAQHDPDQTPASGPRAREPQPSGPSGRGDQL
ncbi:MAG TPA: helix-turn-helix domain-containing protein [Egicoccus sp.]|nr:helix-turn-helix domain-containing protein [Egicoccus sp.]HSK22737.1 helix-turn-helix domain-containing protein [Egicoccus sp.]